MPIGIARILGFHVQRASIEAMEKMGRYRAMQLGIKWQSTKILKSQDVTTVVFVDLQDVTLLPSDRGKTVVMEVTKKVKRGVHIDPWFSVGMRVYDALWNDNHTPAAEASSPPNSTGTA